MDDIRQVWGEGVGPIATSASTGRLMIHLATRFEPSTLWLDSRHSRLVFYQWQLGPTPCFHLMSLAC